MPETSQPPLDALTGRPPPSDGAPVRCLRATEPLDAAAVRRRLADPVLPGTLDDLGLSEPDRTELLAVIPRAIEFTPLLDATVELANALRAAAGPDAPGADVRTRREADDALQARVLPGQGLVAILAHLVSTDTVRAVHAARGVEESVVQRSLADLGQQMRVHRAVTGELGLHTQTYTARIWAGRILAIGRLHVELIVDETLPVPGWAVAVHIPETGALEADAVECSLSAAVELLSRCFGDLAEDVGHRFRCRSWLLGPDARTETGEGSNLAAFARLWSDEEEYDATSEAVYFVFRRQSPIDWRTLPTATRLERVLVDRLRTGHPWTGAVGRLRR